MDTALPVVLDDGLHIYAGNTVSFPIEFSQKDQSPCDLSGYTFTAQWRPRRSSSKHVDLVVEINDLANGKITLTIPGEASNAMIANTFQDVVSGVWDIKADDGDEPVTYLTGQLYVTKSVTHA